MSEKIDYQNSLSFWLSPGMGAPAAQVQPPSVTSEGGIMTLLKRNIELAALFEGDYVVFKT